MQEDIIFNDRDFTGCLERIDFILEEYNDGQNIYGVSLLWTQLNLMY